MYFFISVLIGTTLGLASPNLDTLNKSIDLYNRHAVFPIPNINTDLFQSLKAGEVISILDQTDPDGPQRAVGMLLSAVPVEQLWVSCQDPHFKQQSSTIEKRIVTHPNGISEWYGFIDIPWPFSDRHWLVNVWNNIPMSNNTQNTCWEHPWDIIQGGETKIYPYLQQDELINISKEMVLEAIYTPVNKGAWAVIKIEQHVLLIYHGTTVIGGTIPTDIVAQLVRASMDDMLKRIEARAKKDILTHYTGEHFLILGGDGQHIPHFDQNRSEK